MGCEALDLFQETPEIITINDLADTIARYYEDPKNVQPILAEILEPLKPENMLSHMGIPPAALRFTELFQLQEERFRSLLKAIANNERELFETGGYKTKKSYLLNYNLEFHTTLYRYSDTQVLEERPTVPPRMTARTPRLSDYDRGTAHSHDDDYCATPFDDRINNTVRQISEWQAYIDPDDRGDYPEHPTIEEPPYNLDDDIDLG